MKIEKRIKELGIDLPRAPQAVAAYLPWARTGNLVVTSGQLPWLGDELAFVGKLGTDLNEQQGYQAARLCAINVIAQLKSAVGNLDDISQIVRLEGNVHSGPGFRGHPQVLNGASDLFSEVFGGRGGHTRTALGTNEMPLNSPIQLSVWAEVAVRSAPDRTQESKIAHLTLATRDVIATANFFEKTLGWQPIERAGNIGRAAAWLAIGEDQELHLIEVPDFAPSPFEREFGRHFSVSYPAKGFVALKSKLVEYGAKIIPPERETPFERFFSGPKWLHDRSRRCRSIA